MIRPVELELGEPHVDPRSGPPPSASGDGFLFAETWAAAADALARDPALALAPLRALRDRRFVRPHPGANGWPDAAVPALFAALDASRACAAASPTLAGELWGAAAALLAAWARWHAPAGVAADAKRKKTSPGNDGVASTYDNTLSRIVDVVAGDVTTNRLIRLHVAGGPTGSAPALCLACVAASPAATKETRVRALKSATSVVQALAQRPTNAFASAVDARALAASLAYACAAAEILFGKDDGDAGDGDEYALETVSGEIARAFFPLWRSDGDFDGDFDGGGKGEPPSGAGSSAAAAAAHRAGLLCARATHATATRFFPKVVASLARHARDVLVRSAETLSLRGGGDIEIVPSHPGAAFVATGAFLACRRPFSVEPGFSGFPLDSPENSSSSGDATRVRARGNADALSVAEALAAEAVEAAALVASSLAADDALGAAVADAWSGAPGRNGTVRGQTNYAYDPVAAARARLASAALAAGALGASRCVAERAFDPDAFSFLVSPERKTRDIDESRRDAVYVINRDRDEKRKEACLAATVSGAYRFASTPLSILVTCFAKKIDPASASAATKAASAVPLAKRAHALIELACVASRSASSVAEPEVPAEPRNERVRNFASFAARATRKFATDLHEGYAFFLASRGVGPWRDALNATATRPAFANARLAVVTACDYLTKAAEFDADPNEVPDEEKETSFERAGDVRENDAMTKKNVSVRVSLLLAACDALARVEFARGSEGETRADSVTSALANAARAQMASGRYALALTRLAAALGARTATGAALRERFLSSSVPLPENDADASVGGFETARDDVGARLLHDSRANVYLRLFPYAAVEVSFSFSFSSETNPFGLGNAPKNGALFAKRALPLAAHYVSHQSPTYARAAHLAHAAAFRADPAETVPIFFEPYVFRSLERLYGASAFRLSVNGVAKKSVEEAFAATVFVAAERGGATSAGRAAVAAAARAFVERAARLDTQSLKTANETERHETAAAARTLRRLVFSLLPLVDHSLVPEVQSAAEKAVLSCDGDVVGGGEKKAYAARRGGTEPGTEPPRLAAYADLVRSVMAIGDVARKGAATQWALRLRARM